MLDLVDPPIMLQEIDEEYLAAPSVSSLANHLPTTTLVSNTPISTESQAKPGSLVGPNRPLKTSGSEQPSESGAPWWRHAGDNKEPEGGPSVFEGSSTGVTHSFCTSYLKYWGILAFILF
jgi:hypothetical protein